MTALTSPPPTPAIEPRVSPSRLSDYKQCPQLFKFRFIERLPEPSTVYQARGTAAHLALENLYQLPSRERSPEQLYELFRQAWSELRMEEYPDLFSSTEDERAWGLESMELLANYFTLEDPRSIDPMFCEYDMLEELEGVSVRGILDRIDEDEHGELIITDYKTGKAPPERYALPAFFALKIYALLIRKRLGRTPREVRLLYLNGPTMYRLEIHDKQLDAMDKQVRALWDAIARALRADDFRPRPGRLCDWCSFQDVCPAFTDDSAGEETVPASGLQPSRAPGAVQIDGPTST